MVVTSRQPAISNENTAHLRRQQYYYALNTLLLIILLSLFVFGFNRVTNYETNVTRSTFVVARVYSCPCARNVFRAQRNSTGRHCRPRLFESKETMTGFGVELAQARITTYLFDFPGHGQSSIPLSGYGSSLTNKKMKETTSQHLAK